VPIKKHISQKMMNPQVKQKPSNPTPLARHLVIIDPPLNR